MATVRDSAGVTEWVRRLVLLGVATMLAFLLAEGALRALHLAPPDGFYTVTEKEFQRIPGIFGPGQRVLEQPGTPFEHIATVDSLGYRGRDFPRARPDGEMRVFFSGDSFTWGHNVGDDDTLPAQLEARLRELCGAVTVLNGGLSGSTILEEQAMIERSLTVDPTVVILMYHENDIPELIYDRIWEQLALNRARKSRFPLSVIYPWLRRTVAWNLAQEMLRARRFRAELGPVAARVEEPGRVDQARQEYLARLDSVANLLTERAVPLLFVAFPRPESVTAGRGGEHYAWVVATAADLGLPTVDLLEILVSEGVPVGEAYFVPSDYHPSPEGHAFAASRLATVLSGDPRYGCPGAPAD